MNLLNTHWVNYRRNKGLIIRKKEDCLEIENVGEKEGKLLYPIPYVSEKSYLEIAFQGSISGSEYVLMELYNFQKKKLYEITFNSESVVKVQKGVLFLVLMIRPKTKVKILKLDVMPLDSSDCFYDKIDYSDLLIISPSYPTPENKYLSGFIHSRIKQYKKAGLKFTVVCAYDYNYMCSYEFEGIHVIRVPLNMLRKILQLHNFKKIAIHFFDKRYARILDASYCLDKEIILWVHGPETLYWDWQKFTTPYYELPKALTEEQVSEFKERDVITRKYNKMSNVKWVFVSNWIKLRSEKLIKLRFNNYFIIPNFVDQNTFKYTKKTPDLRKKIFMIRRYDNINKYAVDIFVQVVRGLSKKPFFKNLDFNIYGTGDSFDLLFSPIKDFKNVHFNKRFLTHSEIAEAHRQNGIGFFPTRYDAQGVSMCEAAMSGLAIISSINTAIKEFIPFSSGNLVETENVEEYIKQVEKLYFDEKTFLTLSKECHKKVMRKCSYDQTIAKEIKLFKSDGNKEMHLSKYSLGTKDFLKTKILSVIVPAYNAESFLEKCVSSILNHKNRGFIDVIIVNDGSTDETLNVARNIQDKWNIRQSNLVRIINKDNGGHGSAINVGIKNAIGKYTRIVDSDDWVDSEEISNLIDKLKKEDSDIVITNFSEDRIDFDSLLKQEYYSFLTPGLKYNMDYLCEESHGFQEWGPILATSNVKAELLKSSGINLTENSPYVDMEFDAYLVKNATTLTYYNLDVYRYFIGREDQSISKNSFMKNYLKHENILFNIIKFVNFDKDLSTQKKEYISKKIIDPMIRAQYLIVKEYYKSPKKFRNFDSKLKSFSSFYNSDSTKKLDIFFARITGGASIFLDPIFDRLTKNKVLNDIALKCKDLIFHRS